MKKMNGVTMDGSTVIDIDCNLDEIVIPEYADDTTYKMPLYGIKCLTISSISLLLKFIGLPKKLILNDKNLSYGGDMLTTLFLRPGMEWLEVTEKNTYYKTVDGMLYTKDGKTLVRCPSERKGDVIIPEGTVSIGMDAFRQTKISSVTFPDSMCMLYEKAFGECRNLERVNFGKGITYIGTTASTSIFESCQSLKKLEFPEQITSIGSKAFYNCSLEEVVFHEGLKTISQSAFINNNSLKSVTLPSSIKYIGAFNFDDAEDIYLTGIGVPSSLIDAITSGPIMLLSKKFRAVTIHMHDKAICIPKVLNSEQRSKIRKLIHSCNEYLFGDTFKISALRDSNQDAALGTHLCGMSNNNTKEYLKEQADDMSKRYLRYGDIKHLIQLLETGFVNLDTLSDLIDLMQDEDVKYAVTPEKEPVVMAYIMQASRECRRENEKEMESRFSIN